TARGPTSRKSASIWGGSRRSPSRMALPSCDRTWITGVTRPCGHSPPSLTPLRIGSNFWGTDVEREGVGNSGLEQSVVRVAPPPRTMASPRDKIRAIVELAAITQRLRHAGKTVVQAHGTFDLLHLGHVRHLEAACKLGDVLIVTVTADRFVNKGPGRP